MSVRLDIQHADSSRTSAAKAANPSLHLNGAPGRRALSKRSPNSIGGAFTRPSSPNTLAPLFGFDVKALVPARLQLHFKYSRNAAVPETARPRVGKSGCFQHCQQRPGVEHLTVMGALMQEIT